MGKNKGANRTKGNLQPSSSGRSAELLGGVTEFVGFGGLKDLGYVPAATQCSFEDDTQISAELRITLRKMSKKDTVTKIKAIQEFESLCISESNDSIKTVLPFWPRLYCKLIVDSEKRVRECAHFAHKTLINQVGKELAPHLRAIMPSWLLSMTDPHIPAATASCKSFQSAFSQEKRPGVIVFCHKEIIDYFSDNLFIQTSQTLSDPKTTPKEEQESKYLRVVSCSLKGLCLFLSITKETEDKKDQIFANVLAIIRNEKFWLLSKHPNSNIRSSWFDAIKSFCEYDHHLLQDNIAKLSKIIISSLDCSDSIVLPHVWVAFLSMCIWIPKCWEHTGSNQSVYNRINSVIRNGGNGSATDLAKHYLPILSITAKTVIENRNKFYIEFFKAISTSLCKEKILTNKKDICAIVTALHECLKYVSKIEESNKLLWDVLIKYQVVQLLTCSFIQLPQLGESNYFHELSKLLVYWSECDGTIVNNFSVFWHLFTPECRLLILEMEEIKISKLKDFFQIMREPSSIYSLRTKGVRFQLPESMCKENNESDPASTNEDKNELSIANNYSLFMLPVMETCLKVFNETENEPIFDLLSFLILSFSTDETYKSLGELSINNISLVKKCFLEGHILPLLDSLNFGEQTIYNAIDVFFHIYQQLDTVHQESLLQNLKPTMKTKGLRILINKMADRLSDDSVAVSWLNSSPLGCRLLKCLQQICAIVLSKIALDSPTVKAGYEDLYQLFDSVFTNCSKKERIFSSEYISQMFIFLNTTLLSECSEFEPDKEIKDSKLLELTLTFIEKYLRSSVSKEISGFQEILKSLFNRLFPSCSLNQQQSKISEECILEALRSCFDQPLKDKNNLLHYILSKSKELILSPKSSFSMIFRLINFLKCVFNILGQPQDTSESVLDRPLIRSSLSTLLPSTKEWNMIETNMSSQYVLHSAMSGSITCLNFPSNGGKAIIGWDTTYPRICLVVSKILSNLTANMNDTSLGSFTYLLVSTLHAESYMDCMMMLYGILNHNEVDLSLKEAVADLKLSNKSIILKLSNDSKVSTLSLIKDKSISGRQDSWCVTFAQVCQYWMNLSSNSMLRLNDELDSERHGYVQTKQALLPCLPIDEIINILLVESTKLLSFNDAVDAIPSLSLITTSLNCLTQLSDVDKSSKIIIRNVIHTCFTVLTTWRDESTNCFIFASDLETINWDQATLIFSCIRLLTSIIRHHPLDLLHTHWDTTLCSLSCWNEALIDSTLHPESDKIAALFLTSSSELAFAISGFILKLKKNTNMQKLYPPTLLKEWIEFFAPNFFPSFLWQFIKSNDIYQKERQVMLHHVCRNLALCVKNIDIISVEDLSLTDLLEASDDKDGSRSLLPEYIQSFLNHICPILSSYHSTCQVASYSVLDVSLHQWMHSWDSNQADIDDEDVLPQRPIPKSLNTVIEQTGSLIEVALNQMEIGCCCEIVPYTDTHTLTTGYLLAWLLVLKAVAFVQERNQQLYYTFIRETGILNTLLKNLFRLMPTEPFGKADNANVTIFSLSFDFLSKEENSSETIADLACHVYLKCLQQMPAAVRSWFSNLDRSEQHVVDKYTTAYVSPTILASEIKAINGQSNKLDNMTIKARPVAREVVAVYSIDEASMELMLKMAPNHPLSIITIEEHKRVGISVAEWRNWLFGLNTMLSHRNTPLLSSLEFWKKNVDQKFKGIEECFICYYVLHGTTYQVPKLLCRTCKKKFHSACLYKWFNTSNNSTCPLCRSLF